MPASALWVLLFLCFLSLVSGIWLKYALVGRDPDTQGSTGHVPFVKISSIQNNGPHLNVSSYFGCSVANMGDLDGDGIHDLAVGARGETGKLHGVIQLSQGSVYILFLNADMSVKNYTKISGNINGGPTLQANAQFGFSLANIGDLDGDGINDLCVGAPGTPVPSAFVIFMTRTGRPKNVVLIRGEYRTLPGLLNQTRVGPVVVGPNDYTPNGPPVTYLCYFGSTIASIGDFNKDGIPDIAITASDASGGNSKIYFLYMFRNGTVNYWSTIAQGYGGGPIFTKSFVDFGSSLALVGDIDGDGIQEIAIGSQNDDDNAVPQSGSIYICFMTPDGRIKRYERLSQFGNLNRPWPSLSSDQCGASVIGLGDINLDDRRQQHPTLKHDPPRRSIPDIFAGCPQSATGGGAAGKLMLYFMSAQGTMQDYYMLPDDDQYGPGKKHYSSEQGYQPEQRSQIGASLSWYNDIQGTGIKGLVVGAPGDSDGALSAGAVYIVFLRRLEYHRKLPCTVCYYATWVGVGAVSSGVLLGAIIAFFYVFRRRPDEIEIAAKKAGIEITNKRERKKLVFGTSATVYADGYTM